MIDSPIGPIPASAKINILSQMDLVRFFYDTLLNKTKLPSMLVQDLFTERLQKVKPVDKSGHVVAMNDYQPALAGFNIMHLNNVHAIPILNTYDKVVGTLSASSLRGLNLANLHDLSLPVLEFLGKDVRDQTLALDTSTFDCTVDTAVQAMLEERIHHLWITNSQGEVSNAFTLTDLLTLFR